MWHCFQFLFFHYTGLNPKVEMHHFIGRGGCSPGCYGPKSSVCPHVGRFRGQHPAETPTPAGEAGWTMPREWLHSPDQSWAFLGSTCCHCFLEASLEGVEKVTKTGLQENRHTTWRGSSFDVWGEKKPKHSLYPKTQLRTSDNLLLHTWKKGGSPGPERNHNSSVGWWWWWSPAFTH